MDPSHEKSIRSREVETVGNDDVGQKVGEVDTTGDLDVGAKVVQGQDTHFTEEGEVVMLFH